MPQGVLVVGIVFGWLKTRHPALGGPVLSLVASCLIVSGVPAAIAWLFGRHMLNLNPALLMRAIAGARQNTASLHAVQDATRSAVPGIGYPVPLAIATMTLSVGSYFFAIFL